MAGRGFPYVSTLSSSTARTKSPKKCYSSTAIATGVRSNTSATPRDGRNLPAPRRRRWPELLSRVTGREVREEHLQALAEQSRSETPSVESVLERSASTFPQVGDYEILCEVGRGGMGVVYLARQLSLGRRVALKMLPTALTGDEVTLARFRRGFAPLARCDHANIVKILNSGTLPDGRPYYAMGSARLRSGGTLAGALRFASVPGDLPTGDEYLGEGRAAPPPAGSTAPPSRTACAGRPNRRSPRPNRSSRPSPTCRVSPKIRGDSSSAWCSYSATPPWPCKPCTTKTSFTATSNPAT